MKRCLAIACLALASTQFHVLASPAVRMDEAATHDPAIVERFLHSDEPRLTSFRALRHLEASTRGGRMSASLDAWTMLDPDGTFRFEVVKESGSGLIRRRVLIAALATEQRSRNSKSETKTVELTPANYDFLVGPGPELGQLTLTLTPKRKSPMLIDGSAIVGAADADLVRIEGQLSESPSFWTRDVHIVQRYARIAGVRAPIELTSRANVRIAGTSTFSMTYETDVEWEVSRQSAVGSQLPAVLLFYPAFTSQRDGPDPKEVGIGLDAMPVRSM